MLEHFELFILLSGCQCIFNRALISCGRPLNLKIELFLVYNYFMR